MVMQPTGISWVGGSHPGLLSLTPPPPLKVSRPGFEPLTANFASAALCDSAGLPHCLKPVEQKLLTPPHPTPPPPKSDIQF